MIPPESKGDVFHVYQYKGSFHLKLNSGPGDYSAVSMLLVA